MLHGARLCGTLAALVALMTTLAGGCRPSYAETGRPGLPPGVDLDRLEPHERKTFKKIVEAEPCACGAAHSLSTCIRSHASCKRSKFAVRLVFRRLRQAFPEDEILKEMTERYRPRKPVAIDTSLAARKGPVRAPVTIIEFSDFECPACKRTAPILDKLIKEGKGKVKLYYKHYPLRSHQHAQGAAQAAEAAKRQGKFWAMHDKLFANQSSLSPPELVKHAADLGLDVARFKQDLNAEATKAIVAKDRAEGDKLNLRGTPTLYVNGRLYLGPIDLEELKAYVEEESAGR